MVEAARQRRASQPPRQPRPKKDDVLTPGPLSEAFPEELNVPPLLINGAPNPQYFRFAHRFIEKEAWNGFAGRDQNSQRLKDLKSYVDAHAQVHGFDPKVLADVRTDAEKALDAAARLAKTPQDLFELLDEEITAIESAVNKAMELGEDYLRSKIQRTEEEVRRLGKWLGLLARVRRLRDQARKRVPPSMRVDSLTREASPEVAELRDQALEATRPIRLMLYTGRSQITLRNPRPAELVYQIAGHHAKMACDYWIARNEVGYIPHPDKARRGAVALVKGVVPYVGMVCLCPMGHGKTDLFLHVILDELCNDTKLQIQYLHAREGEATKNLGYTKRCFSMAERTGRRRHALYPGIVLDAKDNDSTRLRIRNAEATKQPNITASGVDASGLGGNLDILYGDDVVPQSDSTEESERIKRYETLSGTWSSRLRGKGGFRLLVGTPWHHDDALMRYIEEVHKYRKTYGERGLCMMVSRQGCGGPNENFKPLWTSMYNSSYLRSRYNEFRPRLYSSAYRCNPLPDESRLVKKLRFYDPRSAQHEQFLGSCIYRLSIDPSGTREAKSDRAGVLYLGTGLVRNERIEGKVRTIGTEMRVRVLGAWEEHANQVDICSRAVEFMRTKKVDKIHYEGRSGYRATGDIFTDIYGLPASSIIRYDPKNTKKGERLKATAVLIDDSMANQGIRAVVEFPAMLDEDGQPVLTDGGHYQIDPGMEWMARQILDFGSCTSDHALDALMQVLIDLMHELRPGEGELTTHIREAEKKGDPRILALLDKWSGKETTKSVAAEDAEWMLRNSEARSDRFS